MMGVLFSARGVAPSELKEMTVTELRYWYEWHEAYQKKESAAYHSRTGN